MCVYLYDLWEYILPSVWYKNSFLKHYRWMLPCLINWGLFPCSWSPPRGKWLERGKQQKRRNVGAVILLLFVNCDCSTCLILLLSNYRCLLCCYSVDFYFLGIFSTSFVISLLDVKTSNQPTCSFLTGYVHFVGGIFARLTLCQRRPRRLLGSHS